MSRKSLSKKETTIWYLCGNCNCNVFAKDKEVHLCPNDESIPSNCTFISEKKLFANQLTEKAITEDLRSISGSKLNNLVFLHESIFSLCDFILGDNVLISSPALPNSVPVVRSVWPINSTSTTNGIVSVTEEGLFCD